MTDDTPQEYMPWLYVDKEGQARVGQEGDMTANHAPEFHGRFAYIIVSTEWDEPSRCFVRRRRVSYHVSLRDARRGRPVRVYVRRALEHEVEHPNRLLIPAVAS